MFLFWIFVSIVLSASAITLQPNNVSLVARSSAGRHLWRPTRLIRLSDDVFAWRLSTSNELCEPECHFTFAYSSDAGATFHVHNELDDDFCGSNGVVEESILFCPLNKGGRAQESGWLFPMVEYHFSSDPEQRVEKRKSDTMGEIQLPSEWEVENVLLDSDTLTTRSSPPYVRAAVIHLTNQTTRHVVLHALDAWRWQLLSEVPFSPGLETTLLRVTSTKFLLLSGSPGNYTQAYGHLSGRRWEKPSSVALSTAMSATVSALGTAVYGGLKGRPGIELVAARSKKERDQFLNVVEAHNLLVSGSAMLSAHDGFPEEYLETTEFRGCLEETSFSAKDGCTSSSYVAIAMVSADTFIVVYDRLENGYSISQQEGADSVYVMSVKLNESVEAAELLQQNKEKERKDELRRQAAKEADAWKKKARREKVQLEKERRRSFSASDAASVADAVQKSLGGDFIIVRNVDPATVDLEKDAFWDSFPPPIA